MDAKVTKLGLELKVVLEQELALLESLMTLMQEERELLVQFKPHQLLELNKRKELLVLQHSYMEQSRKDLTEKLSTRVGLADTTPTLRNVGELIGGQLGTKLLELRAKLIAVVDGIQELNGLNQKLIDYSIRSVKGSVAFLKRRFFNSDTYSASGVLNQEIGQLSSVNDRA